tara:strand:+ start:600 stop:2264 length:1665 start_codon:yes stop_codon:yes gene_type:complete
MATVDERNKPIRDVVGQQAAGNVDLGAGEYKPTAQQIEQGELFDPNQQGYYMPDRPPLPTNQAKAPDTPDAPTRRDPASYDATQIDALGTIDPATGKPTRTTTGQQGSITTDFVAATDQAQKVGAFDSRIVTAQETFDGAKATPEELEQINITAATAEPSDLATTRGQLKLLEKDFEGGKIPPYAAGPIRAANAQMLARGIGASSMAGQAILQAAMESSVQVAMQDARAFQTFEMQNLSNRQQAAVLNKQMRASILGQELTNAQQAAVVNASKFTEANNLNFAAGQTVALEDSKMAQQMTLTNVSNKQAMAVQRAASIVNMDMANLNNIQQAEMQNAQAFLQMDMANLSNKQQAEVLEFQSNTQRLFNNQSAVNAAEQFNATSMNQINQFYDTLGATVSKQNADRKAAQDQFNVDQYNAQVRYNAKLSDARDKFNSEMRMQIDQSNISWRRNVNTANTAEQNQANKVNAAAVLGLTTASQNNMWQQYRDEASWAYSTSENVDQRNFNLAMTILGQQFAVDMFEAEIEANGAASTGALMGDLLETVFNSIINGKG